MTPRHSLSPEDLYPDFDLFSAPNSNALAPPWAKTYPVLMQPTQGLKIRLAILVSKL